MLSILLHLAVFSAFLQSTITSPLHTMWPSFLRRTPTRLAFTRRRPPLFSAYGPSPIRRSHFPPQPERGPTLREIRKVSPYSNIGRLHEGIWYCNCNLPAARYRVKRFGPNKDKRCKLCL
ncbi:hypothetical protein CC80DRAFT_111946 [Byssothecium circinans]|uniref:Uncharacterized protein n=1 Tax=Byssothecium circinans TaxID=147558 RepID=A0A6A5TQV9_9PLEO|nr:hypothetical protein CC80DRAFT_111946 [Byssothecium circinans]